MILYNIRLVVRQRVRNVLEIRPIHKRVTLRHNINL